MVGGVKQRSLAAGIVILRQFHDAAYGYRVLSLVDHKGFDLPKGQVESFETTLAAALRETEEESGISDIDFRWGLVTTRCNNVTLYIAETSEDPIIRPNPDTGQFEHTAAFWLELDVAEQRMREYLRPSITWAKRVIGEQYVCL
jgi:bis(5'-nucleosidyl)-tetraphosphatase